MLYYLIHQMPIWTDLPDGKRNVRILVIVMVLYMILSYAAREYSADNIVCKFIWHNLVFLILGDIFVNAITYKLYYGRSIIHEVNDTEIKEKHEYDDDTHKYHEKPFVSKFVKHGSIDDSLHLKKMKKQNKLNKEYLKLQAKQVCHCELTKEPTESSETDDFEIPPEIVHKSEHESIKEDQNDNKSSHSTFSHKKTSDSPNDDVELTEKILDVEILQI